MSQEGGLVRKCRGFTLIELLVVMAIIAVLAAMLFPVFYAAREKARMSVCASNFHQVVLAVGMYVDDSDEIMMPLMTAGEGWPPGSSPVGVPDECAGGFAWTYDHRRHIVWPQLIQPYARSNQSHVCPSDVFDLQRRRTELGSTQSVNAEEAAYNQSLRTNMGYNYLYLSPFNRCAKSVGVNSATIRTPTSMIMFVDSLYGMDGCESPFYGGNYWVEPPCWEYSGSSWWFGGWGLAPDGDLFPQCSPRLCHPMCLGGCWPHHNGFVTVAFVDNHIKPIKAQSLMSGVIPRRSGCRVIDRDAYFWDRGKF